MYSVDFVTPSMMLQFGILCMITIYLLTLQLTCQEQTP